MTAPDYGRAFARWRAEAGSWPAYTRHDFVEGLKDGALPRAAFLNYLRQDYLFLIHFSRAWALGVTKAETLEEMKACAASVDALINGEMRLHVEVCAAAGISEAELFATEEASENLAYTRYVLEAGYSGDFLDLMAALAPCILGYGEIGLRLAREATSSVYSDWIDTYSGHDFQTLCRDTGALIDSALTRRCGPDFEASPRMAALSTRFAMATRLEVGFWDMGVRGA